MHILIFIFSSYRINEAEHSKLEELFRGVKSNKKSRHYVTALLLRRLVFVVVLISCVSINSKVLIGILSGIQLIYLAWIVFIQPYEEIKGNMTEIINEIYFTSLFFALTFLNIKDE